MYNEYIGYDELSLGELQEIISEAEDRIPKDRRTIRYREYVSFLNELFKIYNEKRKEKVYKLIK